MLLSQLANINRLPWGSRPVKDRDEECRAAHPRLPCETEPPNERVSVGTENKPATTWVPRSRVSGPYQEVEKEQPYHCMH